MKICYFLTAIFASLTLLVSAQTVSDPLYMVLTMRDGGLKAIDIADINRVTFPNGTMIVQKKNDTTEEFVSTQISQMEFSNNETGGINDLILQNQVLTYNSTASALIFEGIEGKVLCIYNVNGALVLRHIANSGIKRLDLSALSKGAYVATYNGQSLKFVK